MQTADHGSLSCEFSVKMSAISLLIICFAQYIGIGYARVTFPLLMPDVQPTVKETYLCTSFRMPTHDYEYIVEFEPNATMHTAHHIIIYGCTSPGYWERDSPRFVWDCGEMAAGAKSAYRTAPACGSGSQIIYAWAKDAPALSLPEGVGFKVGAGTSIKFLVLQVHYANVDKFVAGGTDNSGIFLRLLPSYTDRVNKRAGVYLLGTGGMIPSKSIAHMETACRIEESVTFYPFAFRTHTHKLGKVVAGYVIKPDKSWHMIGKHDPQQPQMFYPAEKGIQVERGDVLAARCTMYNFRNRTTEVGTTAADEMCNFYVMYYVNGDKVLNQKYCFTSGPPMYHWQWDETVGNMPDWVDEHASTLDSSSTQDSSSSSHDSHPR